MSKQGLAFTHTAYLPCRWKEALAAGKAPPVFLACTHSKVGGLRGCGLTKSRARLFLFLFRCCCLFSSVPHRGCEVGPSL